MKVFLCGQRSFGRAVLARLLADGHQVLGVAVPPQGKYYDKVRALALKERIPVIVDSDRLTSSDIPAGLDLVVAAHAHHFISSRVIALAKCGAIGFHPSALPRHRGRDAVRWAVAMRDPIVGATVYWLTETVDGGPILAQRFFHVHPGWDHHDLWRAIFPHGVDLISEACALIASGKAPAVPQDGRFATWEPAFDSQRLFRPELIRLPEMISKGGEDG